jgi:uncharacterized membrane protein
MVIAVSWLMLVAGAVGGFVLSYQYLGLLKDNIRTFGQASAVRLYFSTIVLKTISPSSGFYGGANTFASATPN